MKSSSSRSTPALRVMVVALVVLGIAYLLLSTDPGSSDGVRPARDDGEVREEPSEVESAIDVERSIGVDAVRRTPASPAVEGAASHDDLDVAHVDQEGWQFAVFVRDSDVVVSGRHAGDFFSLRFPLLRPTEARAREFLVFGVVEGQEPDLLLAHVQTTADEPDLPILLDCALWDRFEQAVVTVPAAEGERARIVVSVSRSGRGEILTCPGDSRVPCEIVDFTEVNPDGFLMKHHERLDAGASRRVPKEDIGLVYLVNGSRAKPAPTQAR